MRRARRPKCLRQWPTCAESAAVPVLALDGLGPHAVRRYSLRGDTWYLGSEDERQERRYLWVTPPRRGRRLRPHHCSTRRVLCGGARLGLAPWDRREDRNCLGDRILRWRFDIP